MTVVHRNSLILRRHARAMREHADQFRTFAAQGVVVPIEAKSLLDVAQLLEAIGNDLARTSEAVSVIETIVQNMEEPSP